MAEEYTQYTFNLPGGEQSIQTALSLDDAKQKALESLYSLILLDLLILVGNKR